MFTPHRSVRFTGSGGCGEASGATSRGSQTLRQTPQNQSKSLLCQDAHETHRPEKYQY